MSAESQAYIDLLNERNDLREEVEMLNGRLSVMARERDLAVAHDRQPYPTAYAYERICQLYHQARWALLRIFADPTVNEVSSNPNRCTPLIAYKGLGGKWDGGRLLDAERFEGLFQLTKKELESGHPIICDPDRSPAHDLLWTECFDEKGGVHWPPRDTPVLALHASGHLFEAQIEHDNGNEFEGEPPADYWFDIGHSESLFDDDVTHWCYLPPKPAKEENRGTWSSTNVAPAK